MSDRNPYLLPQAVLNERSSFMRIVLASVTLLPSLAVANVGPVNASEFATCIPILKIIADDEKTEADMKISLQEGADLLLAALQRESDKRAAEMSMSRRRTYDGFKQDGLRRMTDIFNGSESEIVAKLGSQMSICYGVVQTEKARTP